MATYIANTYSGAEEYLDRTRGSIQQSIQLAERARLEMKNAEQFLTDLQANAPVGWAESRQYVIDQAAANPDDVEWQNLLGRQRQMQQDFLALEQMLSNVNAAIDANWTI